MAEHELAAVNFDDVRKLALRICRELDGTPMPLFQAAVVFAYIVSTEILKGVPVKEEQSTYASAMISQIMSALPPVIEDVIRMTPEELALATMPVKGTS